VSFCWWAWIAISTRNRSHASPIIQASARAFPQVLGYPAVQGMRASPRPARIAHVDVECWDERRDSARLGRLAHAVRSRRRRVRRR
jgi:hypothetical protein